MGHIISINSRKFLGSDFYDHNQKHSRRKEFLLVGTLIGSFQILCSASIGMMPFLMTVVSLTLGIGIGLVIYYYFPFKIVSLVDAGNVSTITPNETTYFQMRNAA